MCTLVCGWDPTEQITCWYFAKHLVEFHKTILTKQMAVCFSGIVETTGPYQNDRNGCRQLALRFTYFFENRATRRSQSSVEDP